MEKMHPLECSYTAKKLETEWKSPCIGTVPLPKWLSKRLSSPCKSVKDWSFRISMKVLLYMEMSFDWLDMLETI